MGDLRYRAQPSVGCQPDDPHVYGMIVLISFGYVAVAASHLALAVDVFRPLRKTITCLSRLMSCVDGNIQVEIRVSDGREPVTDALSGTLPNSAHFENEEKPFFLRGLSRTRFFRRALR